jgi:hypothetical protein
VYRKEGEEGRRGGGEERRRGEGEKEKKKVEGRKETMQVV